MDVLHFYHLRMTYFPVPPGYDCMLRYKYGDYMQLPPEESKHSNHGKVIIDLTHDWEELKQTGLASQIEGKNE